ncbi:MAG: polyprenyl synthetase family protein [Chloroflexi bacterium]|nr:polyprenyl synthetase family protein [Chloroflexota bacterium]
MSEPDGFDRFARKWLPLLEAEMRSVLAPRDAVVAQHYQMMHYHMGWVDEAFQPGVFDTGKRIRPLLCLMACAAVGGDPATALPAAAAVEILHNFSLIHDDIEDGDETRRHRPTVWKRWGMPQAINAGDGMFALAFAALLGSSARGVADSAVLAALARFTTCCVALTEGQHLDLRFEQRETVAVADYLRMIEGKTASLVAASLSIGALLGGAEAKTDDALYRFGRHIGLAFQIRDDILGIWGDPALTGKAAGNDILRRKKSLPLLYALEEPTVGQMLTDRMSKPMNESDLPEILDLLAEANARSFTEEQVRSLHQQGLAALTDALGPSALRSPLGVLADDLLRRQA